jgi:hypothetical protein
MSQENVFTPAYGKGITVAPTASSATSEVGDGYKQLCLTNLGSVVCYVRPVTSSGDATTADYPILPNVQTVITKDKYSDKVSYITSSGTGSLHIIAGDGF